MDGPDDPEWARSLRRRFLRGSALAVGAAMVPPVLGGCGAAMPGRLGRAEERALRERLENGLATVRGVPRGEMAEALRYLRHPERAEDVLRMTLESLVVTDVSRSAAGGSPSLARRLAEEAPIVGVSTTTHHALLSGMPSSEKRALDGTLRAEPDLPMEIAGWVDRHAARLGTAAESRAQLRLSARELSTRARRQSAHAVIDDCVGKVGRVLARGAGAPSPAALTQAIWQQVDGAGQQLTSPSGGGYEVPRGYQAYTVDDADEEWERFMTEGRRFWSARWRRPGDEEILIGSVMMPFGAISCGLFLLIGLAVLIAGHVQNGQWDG